LAGVGSGLWDDARAKAESLVSYERELEPDPVTHAAYAELYERWSAIYPYQLALAEARLSPPLWWPAGADEVEPTSAAAAEAP